LGHALREPRPAASAEFTGATGDTFAAGLHSRQRGVAAVEFALIAGIMVMLLMGMFVYWRVLQAQQSVARATGDGARIVQHLAYGGMAGYNPAKPAERANILQATTDVVNQSLAASGIPPGSARTQVQISWGTSQATLSVVYMLPPVLGQGLQVGNQTLGEPTRLESRSLIRLTPAS
jgi:Flp pilus assembly protein TadG